MLDVKNLLGWWKLLQDTLYLAIYQPGYRRRLLLWLGGGADRFLILVGYFEITMYPADRQAQPI